MVSSRVHTQLLKLSDERAEAAERRVKELESQVIQILTCTCTPHTVSNIMTLPRLEYGNETITQKPGCDMGMRL